jgi:hypothetical protein
MLKKILFPMALAMSLSLQAQTAAPLVTYQSSLKQTALLELYTSEGCSSCPPADAWLAGLKESPGLWKDFVPVAWHVDYWNGLGWRDPWSNDEFADRQRAYAAAWHSDTIYTPELVLNGKEWSPWFRPKGGPPASGIETGVLTVSSSDQKHWQAQFIPQASGKAHYQIHGALLASGLGSDVKAGENNGRHLDHDFVVLSLADQYLPGRTNMFQGQLTLDAAKEHGGRPAAAFWVTRINELEPVQAVGGWLASPSPVGRNKTNL